MSNGFDIIKIQNHAMIESAKQEVRECNTISKQYGLSLSENDIKELVECRISALKDNGRIEFSGGILPKLIYAFCDSPFIEQETYEVTLAELQEAFYYFKTESSDQLTDDELIEYMVKVFNGRAQGSAEYLIGTSLGALCRYARNDFYPTDAGKAGDLF